MAQGEVAGVDGELATTAAPLEVALHGGIALDGLLHRRQRQVQDAPAHGLLHRLADDGRAAHAELQLGIAVDGDQPQALRVHHEQADRQVLHQRFEELALQLPLALALLALGDVGQERDDPEHGAIGSEVRPIEPFHDPPVGAASGEARSAPMVRSSSDPTITSRGAAWRWSTIRSPLSAQR